MHHQISRCLSLFVLVVILVNLFAFKANAAESQRAIPIQQVSLYPQIAPALTCAPSKFYGIWFRDIANGKPSDRIDRINFYYNGPYCGLAISLNGGKKIAMTSQGQNRLVTRTYSANGFIEISADYISFNDVFFSEGVDLTIIMALTGNKTTYYTQRFRRLRLR